MNHNPPSRKLPVFYAHRLGAAEVGRPLNSLAGFDEFLDLREETPGYRVEGVETDCSITADRELVLIHRARLDIKTDATGWVHEIDSDTLRLTSLKDTDGIGTDEPVFFARDFFRMLATDERARELRVLFEIKSYADSDLARTTSAQACDLILEYGLDQRVDILSYWHEACDEAAGRGVNKRFTTHGNPDVVSIIRTLDEIGVTAIDFEHFLITEERLRFFQDAGINVTTCLMDPPPALLDRQLKLGLDGITTDRAIALNRNAESLLLVGG